MLAKNKGIIIGLGAIILLAVGYLVFFNQSPSANLTSSEGGGSPAELYFVNLSGELDDISFDMTVLNDARFNALTDIRTAILPETVGRPDPFAPIPGLPK
jgi:hypothetical protein